MSDEKNQNFLQWLIDEARKVVEPVVETISDPAARRAVLRDLGEPTEPRDEKAEQHELAHTLASDQELPGSGENPLDQEKLANIDAYVKTVDPDREAFLAAISDLRAVARAAVNMKAVIGHDHIAQNIVDSAFQLVAANVLFHRYPWLYWLSQPFAFGTDVATTDPLLERLGKGFLGYFRDKPDGPRLREDWLAALATGIAVGLEKAGEHNARRFKVFYGWEGGPKSPTPVGDALGSRALSIAIDAAPEADLDKQEAERTVRNARVIVTLISILADQGGPGTLLSFSGKFELQKQLIEGWLLKLAVDAASGFSVYLPEQGSPDLQGPENAKATLTWERKPDPNTKPWILPIGPARIEFGRAVASLGISRSGFEGRIVLEKTAFVLEPGDDEMLKRGLKSGSLRVEFDLGLGYADGKFFIAGGAALQVTLPAQRKLGPVEVRSVTLGLRTGSLPDQPDVCFETSITFVIELGSVTLTLDRIGCTGLLNFSKKDQPFQADVDFKPPSGIGLKVDADFIAGGGYIFQDPQLQQYAGVVELKISKRIDVKAIALLARKIDDKPAFSLLLIITAEGFRPLNLGMGFQLAGIGGIFGIDRSINTDALEKGVKTGALDSLLFPKDPIGDAPRVVATAGAVFPPTRDRNILGLMVRIIWGVENVVTIDLAVVLEFAGWSVRRIALLGKVRTAFPTPDKAVVQINLDLVGTIDRDKKRAFAHLAITAGKIGVFNISGEAAMLYTWGDRPNYVVSIGGFNPRFQKPDNFPSLERVKFSLTKNKDLSVDATFYVALTSNSFQIGGSLSLVAKKSKFTLIGSISIDALIQSQQPCYAFDLHAKLQLRVFDEPLFAVSLDGTLIGDKPWTISAKASFEIWIFDYTVHVSHTWGETEEDSPPPVTDVEPDIILALGDRRNWIVDLPPKLANPVLLRRVPGADPNLNPLGLLQITQRVAPLGELVTRCGNARLRAPNQFQIRQLSIAGTPARTQPINESFAPAQFVDMTDDEKLGAPAFEDMQAGVRTEPASLASGRSQEFDSDYVTSVFNPQTRLLERPDQDPAIGLGTLVKPIFRDRELFALIPGKLGVQLGKAAWRVAAVEEPVPALGSPAPAPAPVTFTGSLAEHRVMTSGKTEFTRFQLLRTTR